MARSSIRISIPQPCNIPWESMSAVDAEKRYCSSCERVITDFSKMSDAELLAYFQKNKNYCGRFSKDQLDREIVIAKEKRFSGWKKAVLFPSILLGIEVAAQTNGTADQATVEAQTMQPVFPATVVRPDSLAGDTLFIEGAVTDTAGEPLAGAVVMLYAGTVQTGASSDFNGKFRIAVTGISPGDSVKIAVHYVGFDSYEMMTRFPVAPVNIQLRQNDRIYMVGGITADSHPARSRFCHFFWRLFHWRRY